MQAARATASLPSVFDCQNRHSPNETHPLRKPFAPLPLLPPLASPVNSTEQCFSKHVLYFRPFPPSSETGPQSPALQTFRPFFRKILRQIACLLSRYPF